MALRSLLEVAEGDEAFAALAARVGAAGDGEGTTVPVSAGLRPYLLAALAEAEPGLAGRPLLVVAADDRGARDLAGELGAYLAPRRVRYYPSRGTGYESHLAPPPHLVGLRIAALDALVGTATRSRRSSSPAPSRSPRRFPTRRCGRPGSPHEGRGGRPRRRRRAARRAGYERIDQVEERGQFAVRGGILDVFGATEDRAARMELFGDEIESIRWFSTFTQRSLGESERIELAPAAELGPEHGAGRDSRRCRGDGGAAGPRRAAPIDRFRARSS